MDTGTSVLKKTNLQKIFSGNLKKKVFKISFQAKKVKNFFQVISTLGKEKKVFANFLPSFWRFLSKFQRFK